MIIHLNQIATGAHKCIVGFDINAEKSTNEIFFFTSASLSFQRLLRNEIKRLHHKIALVRVWKISTTYKMADIRA